MPNTDKAAFLPGKFKFSLQTGVGGCRLAGEPFWFRILAERRGHGASCVRSGGLRFFTGTAPVAGSTPVTVGRMGRRNMLHCRSKGASARPSTGGVDLAVE
jgi:hypothetical protein